MPFSTSAFWAAFLLLFVFVYFLRKKVTLQNLLLLTASYIFYYAISGKFLGVLIALTLFSYVISLHMRKTRYPTLLLWIGLSVCLGVLGYFKYADFFLTNISSLFPSLFYSWTVQNILLPLGLSFYVFQIMGYFIDVYRNKYEPTKNLLDFALFTAFFPKIVAGPIERGDHLLPQIAHERPISREHLSNGMFLIVWGLFQKLVIADNAAILANKGFDAPLAHPGFFLIIAVLAFTLQIYADFSGYSDIARGMGSLLGFNLTKNFNIPYISASPSEFWRRWHISLSTWFRDYLYIPLGGNRGGFIRTSINLLITMSLVGLWHGAQWTFVLWGFYCGLLLVIYLIAERYCTWRKIHFSGWTQPFGVLLFFFLTVFGWLFFRAYSLKNAFVFLSSIGWSMPDIASIVLLLLLWSPIILMDVIAHRAKNSTLASQFSLPARLLFFWVALYSVMLFSPSEMSPFIYIRF